MPRVRGLLGALAVASTLPMAAASFGDVATARAQGACTNRRDPACAHAATDPVAPPAPDPVRHAVPSGIASDCSADVTTALQDWIATTPDGAVIAFPSGSCYRIDGTVTLENRNNVTIRGNGATFRAVTPGAAGRAHWRIIGGRRVVVRDVTIIGPNAAAGTPSAFNADLEGQHAVDVRGVQGLVIRNVTAENVFGDCFYVGPGSDQSWSTNVRITASTCTGSGRMGVAVTAGRNVVVAGNTFDLVGLTSVTVEPNGGATGARDIVVRGNTIGTSGHWTFAVVDYSGGGEVNDVVVTRNTIVNRSMAMTIDHAGRGPRPSGITITDNTGAEPEWFNRSRGVIDVFGADAVTIANNSQAAAGSEQWFVYARDSCVRVHSNRFAGGSGELDDQDATC